MSVVREWAAVFIDGGYFAALLRDYFNEVRVDFLRLSDMLCSGFERFRTYYYDCMPYQSNPPTDEERKRYADKIRFIEYLKKLPRFEVRLDGRRVVLEPEPKDLKERVEEWMNSALALNAEAFTEEFEENWKWVSREYARKKLGLS